ncbi:MAG: hypothetical protein ACJ790_06810 [Myxococcaceae bacterium]
MRALFFPVVLLCGTAFAAPPKELPLDESWQQLPPGADVRDVTPLPEPEPQPKVLTPAQLEQQKNALPQISLPPPPIGLKIEPRAAEVSQRVGPPKPPAPEDFNEVSLNGGKAINGWAVGAFAGFPTFGIQVRRSFFPKFDAGVGFESFYGMMNEGQVHARYQLLDGDVELAAQVMGSVTQFVLKPQNDPVGARWITGHRNWNVAPGLTLSRHPSSPHMPRLFVDVRALIAFDTQPFQKNPLGGVPQGLVVGWNVPVRAGGELPISPSSSFVVSLGFDIHGRNGDSPFMPVLTVGAVVGL